MRLHWAMEVPHGIIISGFAGLARGYEINSGYVQSNRRFSTARTLWTIAANAPAAVSVPSNIAEGKGHRTNREFCSFLFHARGSLLELQTQLLIAQELQYLSKEDSVRLLELAAGIGRSLSGLINSLQENVA